MITMYGTAQIFGIPEASPFVAKTRILFKLAGIKPELKPTDFKKAPEEDTSWTGNKPIFA